MLVESLQIVTLHGEYFRVNPVVKSTQSSTLHRPCCNIIKL